MNQKSIAVIVGSLRKESFNRKMALNLIELAPKNLRCEVIEIGHLSFYNQDFDEAPPKDWVEFRQRIKPFDAVLFVTPEYNRSIPGVLKNAIDIASRPYGQSVWDGKPAAVASVSISSVGGFGANHHLRQSLVFLNMPAMAQPEVYIGNAAEIFDDQGKIKKDSTRQFAEKFMKAFSEWVYQQSKASPQRQLEAEASV